MATKISKNKDRIRFADVVHETIFFDRDTRHGKAILSLIDNKWMQRLRYIKQTGITNLVYMNAEHSRFGHSLGVCYLAATLLNHLERNHKDQVDSYRLPILIASLLHDIGHVAPGSHLAEKIWSKSQKLKHEKISKRIILEDPEISKIINLKNKKIGETVCKILSEDPELPKWTHQIISGGGWNVDRGNWAILDSEMCGVSYGRYNVSALIDATSISKDGNLCIRENRLDALTHFFVARESMYRQVYQHRVLQAADTLVESLISRVRKLHQEKDEIYIDENMDFALNSNGDFSKLPLKVIFNMTEHWWMYHVCRWCDSKDKVLKNLSTRLRDRKLFKTIRLPINFSTEVQIKKSNIYKSCIKIASDLSLDPQYYVKIINEVDSHKSKKEEAPQIILENGQTTSVDKVDPIVGEILKNKKTNRTWIAIPEEIKNKLSYE